MLPTQHNKGETMKKGLKFILVLVIVVVVVIGGFFILLSIPKTAGVEYTDEDLQTYISNTGINFTTNNASIEDIFFEDYTSTGSLTVDATLTSAQASALANAVINPKSVLDNIQINFVDEDTVIASATIGYELADAYDLFPVAKQYKTIIETVKGKSLYIKTSLTHTQDNAFFAELQQVNVGLIPFPTNSANEYGTELGTVLNRVLSSMDGLSVESFKVDGDGLHFKGTIPQETESLYSR
jgi:flagellar basal body-associated protein FliL